MCVLTGADGALLLAVRREAAYSELPEWAELQRGGSTLHGCWRAALLHVRLQ